MLLIYATMHSIVGTSFYQANMLHFEHVIVEFRLFYKFSLQLYTWKLQHILWNAYDGALDDRLLFGICYIYNYLWSMNILAKILILEVIKI